jgi:pimeloyl-ACP methyl ester carboxylesterase
MGDEERSVRHGRSATDRVITLNGLRVHYLDWGTSGKPPLILLHGIARTAHNFDHLAAHFTDRFHVLAVDMRGHGDSEWHPQEAYLVEDYVSDIEALIDALRLREIVLWGNSTGGRVAQMIAGRRPELVAAAVIEDVGPERPQAISNRRANRMSEEESGWESLDALFERTKKQYPRVADDVLREFVEHGSKQRADGRFVWKRDPAILKGFVATELWHTIAKIKAPIVYILGGASDIVPAEAQRELRATLPQSEIITMPGLGHYPSDEEPAQFLEIVDEFLKRNLRK